MKVITVYNNTGGSGKTTTTRNVAAHMAADGLRVLLVDADGQADLTRECGLSTALALDTGEVLQRPALASVLSGDYAPHKAIQRSEITGCDVIPSDRRTNSISFALQGQTPNHTFIAEALARVRNDYDVAIIDCSPNADIITANALYAADFVLIPCNAKEKASEATRRTLDDVRRLDSRLRTTTGIIGTVITQVAMRCDDTPFTNEAVTAVGHINTLAPVLGFVTRREGVGAEKHIAANYRCIANKVKRAVGL